MKRYLRTILLSSGMLAVEIYLLHILIGGILWKTYRHLQQPISDLTATGAPNRNFLLGLTTINEVFFLSKPIISRPGSLNLYIKLLSCQVLIFSICSESHSPCFDCLSIAPYPPLSSPCGESFFAPHNSSILRIELL